MVGAGQIGSRHLQGLARCRSPLEIHVIDSSPESLARARVRWQEIEGCAGQHTVRFGNDCSSAPAQVDLALIATSAGGRAAIIEALAGQCEVKAWVLEKVLAQSEPELDTIVSSLGKNDQVWVNVPRRMMSWHRALKSATPVRSPTAATIDGGDWGLACNAIHFLDLLAWWTGETLAEISTDGLESLWHESKRPGFWEVHGTLHARFSGGSQLALTCSAGPGPVVITLRGPEGEWTVRESEQVALNSDGRSLPGRLEFQSEMSGIVADGILQFRHCALPTVAESIALHRVLLRALLAHWNACMDTQLSKVPIT